MRAGILMNLIGIVLVTAFMYLLGLTVFGISPANCRHGSVRNCVLCRNDPLPIDLAGC